MRSIRPAVAVTKGYANISAKPSMPIRPSRNAGRIAGNFIHVGSLMEIFCGNRCRVIPHIKSKKCPTLRIQEGVKDEILCRIRGQDIYFGRDSYLEASL